MARNPGILTPHTVAEATALLACAAAGTLPTEVCTMIRAELGDS